MKTQTLLRIIALLIVLLPGSLIADYRPSMNVTFELKNVKVREAFDIITEMTQQNFVIPSCVESKEISIRLRNVPIATVIDALAAQLDVRVVRLGNTHHLICADDFDPALPLDLPIAISLIDVDVQTILEEIARKIGLSGAHYEGPQQQLTMAVSGIRLETALNVITESANLEQLWVENEIIHAVAN